MNKPLVMALLGSVLAANALAQELHLFEESEQPATEAAPAAPLRVQVQGNSQPAYTLRSISRFGDRYQAVLVDRAGQVAKLDWTAGQNAPVQNSGFTIVAASSTSLSLQHPPGNSCVSAELAGVFCAADNRSELRLALAAPLASNGTSLAPQQAEPQTYNGPQPMGPNMPATEAVPLGRQVFINPFNGEPEVMPQISEDARNNARELRAARLRQLEQQRIDDADIPPGMQRVRTPFGDRLLPIRE